MRKSELTREKQRLLWEVVLITYTIEVIYGFVVKVIDVVDIVPKEINI